MRPARGDIHKAHDFHFYPQLCEIRVGWSPATRDQVGITLVLVLPTYRARVVLICGLRFCEKKGIILMMIKLRE